MSYSESEVSTILAQLKTEEYVARFGNAWKAHMANGGRSETKSKLKAARENIYDSLRPDLPLESLCLDEWRQAMSRQRIAGGRMGTMGEYSNARAIAGSTLMARIRRVGKLQPKKVKPAIGKRPSPVAPIPAEKPKAVADLYGRIETCAREFGWVPATAILAALTGRSIGFVTTTVDELRDEFILASDHDGFGSVCTPKPKPEPVKPPPTLLERIMSAAAKMSQEDLATLDQLLAESVEK